MSRNEAGTGAGNTGASGRKPSERRRRRAAGTGSLVELLDGDRLVVLVGEGGVGKTSLSAALAWSRAMRGDEVTVLTVDPAPRLGDALGIRAIDHDPRRVALPTHARGSLHAMRLDAESTFDRMVERYAPSRETAEALLANPIYRAVSGQLGGTESYMAFQRLWELHERRRGDLLVLDTPPAANSAELLAAPERLRGLLDTGALAILAEPARIVANAGGTIAKAALQLLLAALERVTGSSLQREITSFVELFSSLLGGLGERTREIDGLLRSTDTAFVLVTRAREADVEESLAFYEGLGAAGIAVKAVVVNRVTPPKAERDEAAVAALPDNARKSLERMEASLAELRRCEGAAVERLRRSIAGEAVPIFLIPARDHDLCSLDDVASLAAETENADGRLPLRPHR